MTRQDKRILLKAIETVQTRNTWSCTAIGNTYTAPPANLKLRLKYSKFYGKDPECAWGDACEVYPNGSLYQEHRLLLLTLFLVTEGKL